jgi:hypothetical protein
MPQPSYASVTGKVASCPTITVTTAKPSCPSPVGCPVAKCIFNPTTLTVPCSCPNTIPTHTAYSTKCGCPALCPPQYTSTPLPCSTRPTIPVYTTKKPTPTKITECPTVTVTTGAYCPVISDCFRPLCISESTVPLPCGCTQGLQTETLCAKSCVGGCAVGYTGTRDATCDGPVPTAAVY